MNIQPQRNNHYSYPDIFQEVLSDEINIYNQAYLELDRPLTVMSHPFHKKTTKEIGVSFQLDGEIKGDIYCFLDMYDKNISPGEINFFKSLFVESMNILVGKMLTDIEEKFHQLAKLASPQFYDLDQLLEIKVLSKESKDIALQTGYKLISLNNEFDCRILVNLKGSKK